MSEKQEPDIRSSEESTNRYELIMIAAREARRLNDFYRIRNVEPKSRVTTEAIRRTRRGVRFGYRASGPELPDDEAPAADPPSDD